MGQNQWYHFGVGAPPILFFLVGIAMRDFDPWPCVQSCDLVVPWIPNEELLPTAFNSYCCFNHQLVFLLAGGFRQLLREKILELQCTLAGHLKLWV